MLNTNSRFSINFGADPKHLIGAESDSPQGTFKNRKIPHEIRQSERLSYAIATELLAG